MRHKARFFLESGLEVSGQPARLHECDVPLRLRGPRWVSPPVPVRSGVALLGLLAIVTLPACASPPDPRIEAAYDFQRTATDLIARDQEKSSRLAALRLGMSDAEVLAEVGPPTRRETLHFGEVVTEVWTFSGELKSLGTLTFEEGKLIQVRVL